MADEDYELVMGDKRWSSWSLRPWLLMKAFGIPFRERLVRLRWAGTTQEIARHSPSGRIPLLKVAATPEHGEPLLVWDSLAIIEFLAEVHPDKAIWPQSREKRALARAVSAEMHSGFYSLRNQMPMDFLNNHPAAPIEPPVEADIRRIVAIWNDCRQRYGAEGDFLFGRFCAADAMFAPVATRFRSYSVDLSRLGDDGVAAGYAQALLSRPEMTEWGEGAAKET
jgi:glutathione S-transferase